MTTLLFATDPHGNQVAYEALLAAAVERGVSAVVLGGDLLPLPHGSGDRVKAQLTFTREWLPAWLRRLRGACGARAFGILGNDDWACCAPHFEALAGEGLLTPLHGRAVPLDGARSIAGYSCVPLTPFSMSDWDRFDVPGWQPARAPRRVALSEPLEDGGGRVRDGALDELRARPTIAADLEALAAASDPARTVYVTHSPPHGTRLDVMHGGAHIGSLALRAFIERHAPPLTLHGHVHESPELTGTIVDRLGRTLSVNPGASRTKLRAALIDLEALDRGATPI